MRLHRHRLGIVIVLAGMLGAALGIALGVFLIGCSTTDAWMLGTLERRARATSYALSGTTKSTRDDAYDAAQGLEYRLLQLGTTVAFRNLEGMNVLGTTELDPRRVTVDDRLHWNDRLRVLGHEGGHLLAPGDLDGADVEVFADAVSALVAQRYGFDQRTAVARHLAMYKASLHVLTDYRVEIVWAANVLGPR